MNVQLPAQMDKAGFLAWLEGSEEPYELVGGRVVMTTRPSRAHAIIVSNLVVALRRQLDPKLWIVVAAFGVDAGPRTLRFPDIMVDHAGGGRGDLTANGPTLLAEVLSPSTARVDLGDKAAEFLHLPTLMAYIVVAQDERKVWSWIRTPEGFPPGPAVTTAEDAVIRVPTLELELALAEFYAGIAFD